MRDTSPINNEWHVLLPYNPCTGEPQHNPIINCFPSYEEALAYAKRAANFYDSMIEVWHNEEEIVAVWPAG